MPLGALPGDIPEKNSVLVRAGPACASRSPDDAACEAPCGTSTAAEFGAPEQAPSALAKTIAAAASRKYRQLER